MFNRIRVYSNKIIILFHSALMRGCTDYTPDGSKSSKSAYFETKTHWNPLWVFGCVFHAAWIMPWTRGTDVRLPDLSCPRYLLKPCPCPSNDHHDELKYVLDEANWYQGHLDVGHFKFLDRITQFNRRLLSIHPQIWTISSFIRHNLWVINYDS